jgi:hypothetical protein
MVKEKSDKKKEAVTEVQGDVEMGDVAPEKVCYIQALLYNSRFLTTGFHQHSHLRKRKRRRRKPSFLWKIYLPWHIPWRRKSWLKKYTRSSKKAWSYFCLDITLDYKRKFKTASKARQVKRGVKEVVKGIRKGEKGYAFYHV